MSTFSVPSLVADNRVSFGVAGVDVIVRWLDMMIDHLSDKVGQSTLSVVRHLP